MNVEALRDLVETHLVDVIHEWDEEVLQERAAGVDEDDLTLECGFTIKRRRLIFLLVENLSDGDLFAIIRHACQNFTFNFATKLRVETPQKADDFHRMHAACIVNERLEAAYSRAKKRPGRRPEISLEQRIQLKKEIEERTKKGSSIAAACLELVRELPRPGWLPAARRNKNYVKAKTPREKEKRHADQLRDLYKKDTTRTVEELEQLIPVHKLIAALAALHLDRS